MTADQPTECGACGHVHSGECQIFVGGATGLEVCRCPISAPAHEAPLIKGMLPAGSDEEGILENYMLLECDDGTLYRVGCVCGCAVNYKLDSFEQLTIVGAVDICKTDSPDCKLDLYWSRVFLEKFLEL